MQQSPYNDIADHIRDNGSRCEYFGCLEMDENKGLHAHVYFVIDRSKKFPHKTLDVTDGAWLHKLAQRRGLNRIHIAQPQNKMHNSNGKKQFFASLDDEAKLADCLERIEYLYKNRSKENVPCREIYFNSNFEANKAKRAKKKPVSDSPSAPKAEQEEIAVEAIENDFKALGDDSKPAEWIGIKLNPEPVQRAINSSQPYCNDKGTPNEKHTTTTYRKVYQGEAKTSSSEGHYNGSGKASSIRHEDGSRTGTHHEGKGINLKLTPAQNYLSTVYERCVDAGMNLDAIRLHLAEQGIKRSPAQVVDELENVFGFIGYAARHPAPQKPDTRMLDALIDKTPLRSGKHPFFSLTL